MKFHTLVVTQIISIVLHHVHVNFMITVEIFVKWVYNFSRSSEIKDEHNDSKYYVSNHLFYYPGLVLFYYFACFLASVIWQFTFISQPWWPTFWLSPSRKKKFRHPCIQRELHHGFFLGIFQKCYIYLFKVNNRNARKKCEIYSKLTIKPPEGRQGRRSGVSFWTWNIIHTFF